jgi:hypothetical protein
MTAKESERGAEEPAEVAPENDGLAGESFVESDAAQTRIPYDKGGVPLYIAFAWAVFLVTYIVVMALLVLPDLRAWLAR